MNSKFPKRIILILLIPVFLLLIPLALQFDWSFMDFAIVYVLLAGAGLAYELVTEKSENIVGWIFGMVVLAIGIINTFWGNQPFFGIFILLLSFVFFPPVNTLFKELTGFLIPRIVKVLLGVFVLWASLGVGELFYKINLMLKSFS